MTKSQSFRSVVLSIKTLIMNPRPQIILYIVIIIVIISLMALAAR